jgi:hypothetical protein
MFGLTLLEINLGVTQMRKMCVLVYWLMVIPAAFGQDGGGGNSDLPSKIQTGQNIRVRLTDGRQIKGSVFEVTDSELTIGAKGNKELIPVSRIQEVSRRHRDPLWNGLLVGAAVGMLLGAASKAANDCDPNECGEKYAVPGGLAFGAAVGIALDALWQQKQVLYRAPRARTRLDIHVLAGRVTGAKVAWRF